MKFKDLKFFIPIGILMRKETPNILSKWVGLKIKNC